MRKNRLETLRREGDGLRGRTRRAGGYYSGCVCAARSFYNTCRRSRLSIFLSARCLPCLSASSLLLHPPKDPSAPAACHVKWVSGFSRKRGNPQKQREKKKKEGTNSEQARPAGRSVREFLCCRPRPVSRRNRQNPERPCTSRRSRENDPLWPPVHRAQPSTAVHCPGVFSFGPPNGRLFFSPHLHFRIFPRFSFRPVFSHLLSPRKTTVSAAMAIAETSTRPSPGPLSVRRTRQRHNRA